MKTAGPLSAACLTAITKPLGLPGIEGSPPTGVEGPAGVFRLSSQVMPCQSESLLHGAALPDGSQGSQAGIVPVCPLAVAHGVRHGNRQIAIQTMDSPAANWPGLGRPGAATPAR